MVDAAGDSDAEKLRREAEELRALVRALSARLAALVAILPAGAAVGLAHGEREEAGAPFRLTEWRETIEVTRADIASEMDLLWKRVPPRESA
ncbi:MAG TPA: hypothetical protein VKS23_05555 [Thermoanaerobaculia bacterium]|nr:hypothetical protein [Thermoanaerobaculia bacterium]